MGSMSMVSAQCLLSAATRYLPSTTGTVHQAHDTQYSKQQLNIRTHPITSGPSMPSHPLFSDNTIALSATLAASRARAMRASTIRCCACNCRSGMTSVSVGCCAACVIKDNRRLGHQQKKMENNGSGRGGSL